MSLAPPLKAAALPRPASPRDASPDSAREQKREQTQGDDTHLPGAHDHDHDHNHAHAHGHAHTATRHATRSPATGHMPQRASASVLMQSAAVRVALAAGLVALLWVAVAWSLGGSP